MKNEKTRCQGEKIHNLRRFFQKNSLFLHLSISLPFCLLLCLSMTGCSGWWTKKPLSDENAIRAGKESLGQGTLEKQFPWYSPTTDDACFVPFPKEREPWAETPEMNLSFLALLIRIGLFILVTLILIPIIYFLVLAIMKLYGYEWNTRRKQEAKERQRRIETLPEEARDVYDDLLGAAEKAFQAGDYHRALIYYFSYQLVFLDQSGLIRMQRGKTNHEYLRELFRTTDVKPFYERTMHLFETVYYGEHEMIPDRFLVVWNERNLMQNAVLEEVRRRESVTQAPDTSRQNALKNTNWLLLILMAGALLLGCGCGNRDIDTDYALPFFDSSINGTTVFEDLCKKSGHHVRKSGFLKEKSNDEILVWFCWNRQTVPVHTLQKLSDWLNEKPDRTIVYVGRAFESDREYWDKIIPDIPDEASKHRAKTRRDAATFELRHFLDRDDPSVKHKVESKEKIEPEEENKKKKSKKDDDKTKIEPKKNDIFQMQPLKEEFVVRSLSGKENWIHGIDVDKIQWSLFEDLLPVEDGNNDFETLLESEGHQIAISTKFQKGRLICVNNGGFLLNYQLINHEHRKLANRLIHEFGDTPKKIFFLYSGHEIVEIQWVEERVSSFDMVIQFLQIWPFSVIFWQFILLGIIFCFYQWPIFGRPKKLPQKEHVNFGEHITAYADLLSSTGDEAFVKKQVEQHQKNEESSSL